MRISFVGPALSIDAHRGHSDRTETMHPHMHRADRLAFAPHMAHDPPDVLLRINSVKNTEYDSVALLHYITVTVLLHYVIVK